MNERLRRKIALIELQKREAEKPIDILSLAFEEQLEFIESDAKRKILCLTRRAAKSTAIAIYLIDVAMKNPNCQLLYVNLTKNEAKATMWKQIFYTMFLKLSIPANLVGMEIRFDNGSIIYLAGVDSSEREMQKLRGKKYALAAIDECQSYNIDLKELIEDVLGPTLADADATICLLGTPGNKRGTNHWYQVNCNRKENKGWAFFNWGWQDNPHVRDKMKKHVDLLIENNPKIKDDPSFRQEYLGEWVIEKNSRVYQSSNSNYIDELPKNFEIGAIPNLIIDFGFNDGNGFVVTAYNKRIDSKLYVLESKKVIGQTISQLAQEIKEYRKRFNFQHIICDAGAQGLTIAETLKREHHLPLESANKLHKNTHIAILNSDFIIDKVMILKEKNKELINELEINLWDAKLMRDGEFKENQSQENELTDCLLYGHNYSRHYWYQEPKPILSPDDQFQKDFEDKLFKKSNVKHIKKPFWEE